MIAIVDYGVGNLFSLVSSLKALGLEAEVTGDAGRLRAADRIILPGVGAFPDAAERLREELQGAGYHSGILLPVHKDWNDDLVQGQTMAGPAMTMGQNM